MKKIITIISVFADTLQRIFSVATDVFSIIATVALMLIRTGLSVFAAQVLFDFVHKAQMGASGYVVASIATVVIIVKYVQAFIRAKHAIFGDAPVLPKVQPNSLNSEDPLVKRVQESQQRYLARKKAEENAARAQREREAMENDNH